MLISKKDLLQETGISYGQLYRWKREGLIPEDWFIKQSSYTGQETFFPREKILNRIAAIQGLKDKYSLEELAQMLSPEVSQRRFTSDDLRLIDELDSALIPCFIEAFGHDSFSFVEVLLLIAICMGAAQLALTYDEISGVCEGLRPAAETLKQADYVCILIREGEQVFSLVFAEGAQVLLDGRLEHISLTRLGDLSSMMKLKYAKSFNFQPEEERS